MHNINDFNVIDTEGFDSMERAPEDKMFEKQVRVSGRRWPCFAWHCPTCC